MKQKLTVLLVIVEACLICLTASGDLSTASDRGRLLLQSCLASAVLADVFDHVQLIVD